MWPFRGKPLPQSFRSLLQIPACTVGADPLAMLRITYGSTCVPPMSPSVHSYEAVADAPCYLPGVCAVERLRTTRAKRFVSEDARLLLVLAPLGGGRWTRCRGHAFSEGASVISEQGLPCGHGDLASQSLQWEPPGPAWSLQVTAPGTSQARRCSFPQ